MLDRYSMSEGYGTLISKNKVITLRFERVGVIAKRIGANERALLPVASTHLAFIPTQYYTCFGNYFTSRNEKNSAISNEPPPWRSI